MGNHLMVGGQAVIEGVMMRGPKLTATAVRDPNGKIQVETKDVNSISDRYPILKKPMLRGTVSLIESLVIGIRSLSYSAKMAGEEDEQLSDKEMAGTILFALVLASILFIAIPTGAARLFHVITEDPFFLNLMEGFLRLAIFLGYIWGISRMKDIRRVFQYHGAEHKTIHCYEAGLPLTVENVQKFSRLHPRCGTNFLLIVISSRSSSSHSSAGRASRSASPRASCCCQSSRASRMRSSASRAAVRIPSSRRPSSRASGCST